MPLVPADSQPESPPADARFMAVVLAAFLLLTMLVLSILTCSGRACAASRKEPLRMRELRLHSMGLSITGGFAGLSERIVIGMDGAVEVEKSGTSAPEVGILPAADVAALKRAFHDAGFFQWQPYYGPTGPTTDARFTEIFYDDGDTQAHVKALDPNRGPAGFPELAARIKGAAARRQAAPRYGHAADFSWVAGRLERSHLEGGFWLLHYQAPGAHPDAHGGKLVLKLPAALAKGLKDGSPVRLHGRLRPDEMGFQMAGPIYEVTKVEPLNDGR